MDKLDIGDRLPLGFCSDCCSRMASGAGLYEALELRAGLRLLHAYCSHREAGATLLIETGRPQRWQILSPIDAVEWRDYVALKAQRTRGVLEVLRDKPTTPVS